MITREANIDDWDKLYIFFSKIYRINHPLQKREFWLWQYGDPKYGRSFICINENQEIVGHVGANFGGNIAWIINVYLNEEFRGKGILSKLYELARAYYPLAATAANEAGLELYRNMRWYRYYDLVRYVKVNPSIQNPTFEKVCQPCQSDVKNYIVEDTHYFKQPGIKGLIFKDGSRTICQKNVGGLRAVDINNLKDLESKTWELGYNWIDYITSWNDFKIKELEKQGWVIDLNSIIPWRLNPVEEGYYCDITFLSEEPFDRDFIVHRSYSDHGRIGSL